MLTIHRTLLSRPETLLFNMEYSSESAFIKDTPFGSLSLSAELAAGGGHLSWQVNLFPSETLQPSD